MRAIEPYLRPPYTFGVLLVLLLALTSTTHALEPEQATFAGGCFWCMEKPFEALNGIRVVTSGYMGGRAEDAQYKKVGSGVTGHREVIQVEYDPDAITYEQLLETFWKNIDPFDENGQFCDKGTQYTTAIYVHTSGQEQAAQTSLATIQQKFPGKNIITPILKATTFYPAEEYHQNYYKKNPAHYAAYRYSCGRDQRLKEIWDR